MKFNSKQLLGILAIIFSQGVVAQLYVGVQSGIYNIENNVEGTLTENKIGGAVRVGYIYPITSDIGIGTGIEFAQYKQNVSLRESDQTQSNYEVDASTSAFEYTVTATNYMEKQTLQAIQIPLFVQLKETMSKGVDFGIRIGAKYFLPLSYKIDATANSVTGAAYYPDVNLTITDLPEHGIGGQTNYAASGEYDTKGLFMGTFEVGFTFDMGEKSSLYTGLFVEKGFGTLLDQDSNESFVGFNPTSTTDRDANGIFSIDNDAKITPLAFGLTLAWNFK